MLNVVIKPTKKVKYQNIYKPINKIKLTNSLSGFTIRLSFGGIYEKNQRNYTCDSNGIYPCLRCVM